MTERNSRFKAALREYMGVPDTGPLSICRDPETPGTYAVRMWGPPPRDFLFTDSEPGKLIDPLTQIAEVEYVVWPPTEKSPYWEE